MSQCSPSSQAASMTCPGTPWVPHAHHISVTSSQRWDWIASTPKPRTLSREARKRYRWLRWHATHGRNVSLTCRHHGISRRTFYRWGHRFAQRGLAGLEDRSHRPHRCRRPSWTPEQVQAVLTLRERYPAWGKAKLAVLLRRQGHDLSVSMVGRILHHLNQTGQLREASRRRRRTRCLPRPYAMRKPKDYVVSEPGDLVQVDTLEVEVTPGARFKHLSLVDVLSRWHAAEIRRGATAKTMRENLDQMRARLPFPIMAIQIDGGSEFRAELETYCQAQGIKLFTLPPRSPKLNGRVERVQRTDREEFYACTDVEPRLEALQPALRAYEDTYNTIRPHQALGYLTPQEYLDQHREAA
jgi:putative transposase